MSFTDENRLYLTKKSTFQTSMSFLAKQLHKPGGKVSKPHIFAENKTILHKKRLYSLDPQQLLPGA